MNKILSSGMECANHQREGQTQVGQALDKPAECCAVREQTVREHLMFSIQRAVTQANNYSKKLNELSVQDLDMPLSQFEQKYSLHGHYPF